MWHAHHGDVEGQLMAFRVFFFFCLLLLLLLYVNPCSHQGEVHRIVLPALYQRSTRSGYFKKKKKAKAKAKAKDGHNWLLGKGEKGGVFFYFSFSSCSSIRQAFSCFSFFPYRNFNVSNLIGFSQLV